MAFMRGLLPQSPRLSRERAEGRRQTAGRESRPCHFVGSPSSFCLHPSAFPLWVNQNQLDGFADVVLTCARQILKRRRCTVGLSPGGEVRGGSIPCNEFGSSPNWWM